MKLVGTVTIDELVRIHSLAKVDYVSLTLNGAEVEAIDGMKETLTTHCPRIRLAGWYVREAPIWEICSEKLKRFDYKIVIGKWGSLFAYKKKCRKT